VGGSGTGDPEPGNAPDGNPPLRRLGVGHHASLRDPSGLPPAPPQWSLESADGPGPFTTRVTWRLPDGNRQVWTSRAGRKFVEGGRVPVRTWWMAVLFSIGSVCFLVGALPWYSEVVSARIDSLTFFAGSIFFTTAASLAYAESVAAARLRAGSGGAVVPQLLRRLGIAPRRIDWWATAVQLVGTVAFNITTLAGVRQIWQPLAADVVVWSPDAVGSICFLVSSYLAFAEVCHRTAAVRLAEVSWWVVVANLAGAVFFGLSAVGAWVRASGTELSPELVNAGTALGGLCFLIGAVLLVPEARRAPSSGSVG
jgi:hypothetical protein